MHRIFPNLYRFDFGPRGSGKHMCHSYLLVRKEGNLLICHCHRGASMMDYADEIEKWAGSTRSSWHTSTTPNAAICTRRFSTASDASSAIT